MENGEHSLWDLLPVILCNILDSDYELFSERQLSHSGRLSGFNAQVDRETCLHGHDSHLAKAVQEVISSWLTNHSDWTLYIIANGLDQWLPSGGTQETTSLRNPLKFFIALAGNSSVPGGKLKLLFLAAHNACWSNWNFRELNNTGDPNRFLCDLEWRQGNRSYYTSV
jgi:hypothetical protein